MYILTLPDEKFNRTASRGYPESFDSLPEPTDKQKQNLKAACEAIGWEFEPKWWLASYLG